MILPPDRRRVARLPIPLQFKSRGLEDEAVRLIDLSPEGACLEHDRPLPDWDCCLVVLPPALGGLHLQGEVVWSRVAGRRPGGAGRGPAYYQSGLSFSALTPAQQDGLAAALQRLKAAQAE
jgi:hypothetical protein